jgi:chitin disaccharide deacetylase
MKLIINADDLGKNKIVNDSIYNLIFNKQVTSVSILPSSPNLIEVKNILKEFPNTSSGIHLYLTEFTPISKDKGLDPFLDENGNFYRNKNIIKNIHPNKRLKNAIYNELHEQFHRLYSNHIDINHMDSHHHVHLLPGYIAIFKDIQKYYSIKYIRLKTNIYIPKEEKLFLLKKLHSGFINYLLKYHGYKPKTTNRFGNLKSFMSALEIRSAVSAKDLIEVSVHPGHESYKNEMILLSELYSQRELHKIEYISFNDL